MKIDVEELRLTEAETDALDGPYEPNPEAIADAALRKAAWGIVDALFNAAAENSIHFPSDKRPSAIVGNVLMARLQLAGLEPWPSRSEPE